MSHAEAAHHGAESHEPANGGHGDAAKAERGHAADHEAHAPKAANDGNGHEAPHAKPANQNGPPSKFAQEAQAAWERTKNSTGGWLMAEKQPVQEVHALLTPIYIIGDWVRGSIGNVFRRGKEVISPAINMAEAAWETVSSPFKSPVKTLFHPIKYAANIPRIFTAGARAGKNLYKAAFTGANEAYQGIIQDPLERVDYKIAKIPKIGEIMATTGNKVANVMGWPLRALDGAARWATDWIDRSDDYMAAAAHA
ncbi:MAG: hypothetical protein WC285_04350 [Candidatus Gracilibacteria bacterium]|jgi:hypothetical protein